MTTATHPDTAVISAALRPGVSPDLRAAAEAYIRHAIRGHHTHTDQAIALGVARSTWDAWRPRSNAIRYTNADVARYHRMRNGGHPEGD